MVFALFAQTIEYIYHLENLFTRVKINPIRYFD